MEDWRSNQKKDLSVNFTRCCCALQSGIKSHRTLSNSLSLLQLQPHSHSLRSLPFSVLCFFFCLDSCYEDLLWFFSVWILTLSFSIFSSVFFFSSICILNFFSRLFYVVFSLFSSTRFLLHRIWFKPRQQIYVEQSLKPTFYFSLLPFSGSIPIFRSVGSQISVLHCRILIIFSFIRCFKRAQLLLF